MSRKSKAYQYHENPEFTKAKEDYEKHFGFGYPYAIGHGYAGKTDEENIAIIRECIEKNEPLDYNPPYRSGCLY